MFRHGKSTVKVAILFVLLILVLSVPMGTALANANPSGTGQPSQSCEDAGVRPGNAMFAPGSAFNPTGIAGTHYAGTQPQNSNNVHSVSQYDVACFQQAMHNH